eukprot:NODE_321_length_9805_cov_0.700185.p8 type:complete len:211 gc:universal NODE_321_length_9805_cov_0.700185:1332-1964(+)
MNSQLGHFLDIRSVEECQKLGTILNYNQAAFECRVYVNTNIDKESNCMFEKRHWSVISNMYGYSTSNDCELVCKNLLECSFFRNETGCILYNANTTYVNDTSSLSYFKICKQPDASPKEPELVPSNTNNITIIISVCVVGGLLLLVILFFILLHRTRSRRDKHPELHQNSIENIIDKEVDDTLALNSDYSSSASASENFYGLNHNRSGPI